MLKELIEFGFVIALIFFIFLMGYVLWELWNEKRKNKLEPPPAIEEIEEEKALKEEEQ